MTAAVRPGLIHMGFRGPLALEGLAKYGPVLGDVESRRILSAGFPQNMRCKWTCNAITFTGYLMYPVNLIIFNHEVHKTYTTKSALSSLIDLDKSLPSASLCSCAG